MMSDKEIKNIANEIYKFNKEIEKIGAKQWHNLSKKIKE
jgi:ATP-dependent protease HslVU (ClpYQ) ATPase subunit